MGQSKSQGAKIAVACLLSACVGYGFRSGTDLASRLDEERQILSRKSRTRSFDRREWLDANEEAPAKRVFMRGEMADSLAATLMLGTNLSDVLALLGSPDDVSDRATLGLESADRRAFRDQEEIRVTYTAGYTDNSTGPLLPDAIACGLELYFSKDSVLLRVTKFDGWNHE